MTDKEKENIRRARLKLFRPLEFLQEELNKENLLEEKNQASEKMISYGDSNSEKFSEVKQEIIEEGMVGESASEEIKKDTKKYKSFTIIQKLAFLDKTKGLPLIMYYFPPWFLIINKNF